MHAKLAFREVSPDVQRLLARGYWAHVVSENSGRDLVFVIRADQLCEELQRAADEITPFLDEHATRLEEPDQENEGLFCARDPDEDGEIEL